MSQRSLVDLGPELATRSLTVRTQSYLVKVAFFYWEQLKVNFFPQLKCRACSDSDPLPGPLVNMNPSNPKGGMHGGGGGPERIQVSSEYMPV